MGQHDADFPTLVSPINVGRRTLRNRVVHLATVTNFGAGNRVTDRLVDYVEARAEGGTAMFITEGLSVHATSIPNPAIVTLFDEANSDGLRRMAEAGERHDCRMIGQLWHVGRQQLWNPVAVPVGVSSRFDAYSWTVPHVMDVSEIQELVSSFAEGARRLKEAGFSGAELHGAHGYLITQFLSPWSNDRDDDYGGDFERRLRFLKDVTQAIRQECGQDFILGIKLPSDEGVEGGIDLDEAGRITETLAGWNAFDYFAFNQGNFSLSLENHVPDMHYNQAHYLDFHRRLRGHAEGVPVMGIGRIDSARTAEAVLAAGMADLAGMSRALVSDPALAKKAAEGRNEDIRPCIFCNVCWGEIHAGKPIACIHNPELGQRGEADWQAVPTAQPKRVAVVGAGVAGLEAAWLAAARGHDVTIFSRSVRPGGKALLESRLPGRGDVAKVVEFQLNQAQKHGVALELDVEADQATLQRLRPDVVVLATGSHLQRPVLREGAEDAEDLRSWSERALNDPALSGGTAVVFDQDHTAATYAAVQLVRERYDRVVVLTPRVQLARAVPYVSAIGVYRRLYRSGVEIETAAVPTAFADGEVAYINPFTSKECRISSVDAFFYATPRRAEDNLAKPLRDAGLVTRTVGDCVAPRTMMAAIHEGHLAGQTI